MIRTAVRPLPEALDFSTATAAEIAQLQTATDGFNTYIAEQAAALSGLSLEERFAQVNQMALGHLLASAAQVRLGGPGIARELARSADGFGDPQVSWVVEADGTPKELAPQLTTD